MVLLLFLSNVAIWLIPILSLTRHQDFTFGVRERDNVFIFILRTLVVPELITSPVHIRSAALTGPNSVNHAFNRLHVESNVLSGRISNSTAIG